MMDLIRFFKKASLAYIVVFMTWFCSCTDGFSGKASADKQFRGSHDGGGGGSNGGGQAPQNGDVVPGGGQTINQPGLPGDNPIDSDGGINLAEFKDAIITGLRLDSSGSRKYNHDDVELRLKVVGATSLGFWGKWPEEGVVTYLPKSCPPTGKVRLELEVRYPHWDTGQYILVRPSKNNLVGGPIGYRLDRHRILVGFEKEAVNDPKQTAYHNNDDAVVEIKCESADIEIVNLCIDDRIPKDEDGSDLVTDKITYNGDDFGRQCNGF